MDPNALQEAQEQEQRRQQMAEQKHSMMQSLLTAEAKERLARVAMVKPEKAEEVTTMVLAMAQRGVLQEKISDTRIKQMIESVDQNSSKPTKITFARKKTKEDEDEEYDL